MDKVRNYGIIILVITIFLGGILFNYLRTRQPTEELQLPQGETVQVTPLDEMRVRTAEEDSVIDPDTYNLEVSGLVENPLILSFEEIMAMNADERLVDLPCVEGWTESALWKGPRLSDILDIAGVQEGADNVIFNSPGGYTTSLTLQDIEETDPLLAYGANGEVLPHEQGFPLRLVVPDRLGYKWIKWVQGIQVISGEYEGYWEGKGYTNEADAADR
ncbi:MAG: molybdopterin-dependent oxidoreductase [Actinomycetota bacterium]|nr:molybdopterin-dependent oxidoreductase [Actinomycetota bacterium]